MKALRPLLGHSPRALKRFLNVYRLLKAGVPQPEQEAFTREAGPESPFQMVLFLLAIVTGTRTLSRPLFAKLGNRTKSAERNKNQRASGLHQRKETLESIVGQLEQNGESVAPAELDALKRWIETHEKGAWKKASVEPFAVWASRVSRCSFRVELRPDWRS